MLDESLLLRHSVLDDLPEPLREKAKAELSLVALPAGTIIFRPGDQCIGLPLVISGSVKVRMTGVSGNQIVLYRMGADDICTLSIGCLMSGHGYRAEALVEEAAEAIMVPQNLFDRMMATSEKFRIEIMSSYGRRLDDLMLLVEEVAFRRMDARLEEWLAARADRGAIAITHQELAIELGTAREVISRLLKELENQGKIVLNRGLIRWA